MMEVATRSGFAESFTDISERHARVGDFSSSQCVQPKS